MKIETLNVGIASFKDFKARALAIARGEYKPDKYEPKIWCASMESLEQVLSNKKQMLLKMIATEKTN